MASFNHDKDTTGETKQVENTTTPAAAVKEVTRIATTSIVVGSTEIKAGYVKKRMAYKVKTSGVETPPSSNPSQTMSNVCPWKTLPSPPQSLDVTVISTTCTTTSLSSPTLSSVELHRRCHPKGGYGHSFLGRPKKRRLLAIVPMRST